MISSLSAVYWAIFWAAVAIFVVVEALLIGSAVRFQRSTSANQGGQTRGGRAEIAWTIVPALLTAAVFFLALQAMLQQP